MRQMQVKGVMESRQIEGVEVHRGSCNVFADLGLPSSTANRYFSRNLRVSALRINNLGGLF